MQRKGWLVRQYTNQRKRQRNACLTLFVTLPVDHLWRHVQYREMQGGALQDLCVPRLNFFAVASRSFYAMLATRPSQSSLAPLFWEFGPPSGPERKNCRRCC